MVEIKMRTAPTHPVLEKDFQKKVIKMIRAEFPDMWFYKASDRFIAGVPDIVGCCKGRMWGIELKVGDNKPTKLQQYTAEQMRCAGAAVIWSNDMEIIRTFLQLIDKYPRDGLEQYG